jgi:valyl-tRNA synthetase
METGYDILFFWVARMIMLGLEFTGEVPFHTAYLHGLIRDDHGHKMSKTSGNVIDPLNVMDELGTDALRFTLLVGSAPGNDTNLSVKKVEANRNFANKIWNVGRFVISAIDSLPDGKFTNPDYTAADSWDSWIWAGMQQLVRDVARLFDGYPGDDKQPASSGFQYGEAGRQIYEFFWSTFADWYVEAAKLQMQDEARRGQTVITLARILDISLRLLHPFTPFITEELWGHLRTALRESSLAGLAAEWPEALIIARWPEARPVEDWEDERLRQFTLIQEIVRSIRNYWAENNVLPVGKAQAVFGAGEFKDLLAGQGPLIAALAGLDAARLDVRKEIRDRPQESMALVVGPVEIYLPLAGIIDIEAHRKQLSKELANVESQISRLEQLLSGEFAQKAPAAVVTRERERLAALKETAEKLQAQLK